MQNYANVPSVTIPKIEYLFSYKDHGLIYK